MFKVVTLLIHAFNIPEIRDLVIADCHYFRTLGAHKILLTRILIAASELLSSQSRPALLVRPSARWY